MRMRKLGSGQSVVFYVPDEIRTKIVNATGNYNNAEITVPDVLEWAIFETIHDLKRNIPVWAAQGRRFVQQKALWEESMTDLTYNIDRSMARKFLEKEAKTIEHRYRPNSAARGHSSTPVLDNPMMDQITQRCQDFDSSDSLFVPLDEEQERQLAPEVEEERQIEPPHPAVPARHRIDTGVLNFVSTGEIPEEGNNGFRSAFESLSFTSAADCFDVTQFTRHSQHSQHSDFLRVTNDFAITINRSHSHHGYDSYQRNVQYILTSADETCRVTHMVVISPFEANRLFNEIKASNVVKLHVYAPRQNGAVAALDHLQLYTIPSVESKRFFPRELIIELNLFAGQLYLKDFNEYSEVCDYLGLAWNAEEQFTAVRADGFIVPGRRSKNRSKFTHSPVQFLKLLMAKIRRDCVGIEKTHMGKILDGMLLTSEDFKDQRKRKVVEIEDEASEEASERRRFKPEPDLDLVIL